MSISPQAGRTVDSSCNQVCCLVSEADVQCQRGSALPGPVGKPIWLPSMRYGTVPMAAYRQHILGHVQWLPVLDISNCLHCHALQLVNEGAT